MKSSHKIARRLSLARVRHNQSLQDVATGSGTSKSQIWELETGRRDNPTISTLLAIAKHFGVTVGWLIGETS